MDAPPRIRSATPDWDALRLVLHVERAGGLAGAAESLGLNAATVFRRLAALEQELGLTLFERRRSGYQCTPAGADLVAVARGLEREVARLTDRLLTRDSWPGGVLRLTTGDTLMHALLPPLLAQYQALEGVQVHVSTDPRRFDLLKGEADVALRTGGPPPVQLVGRRLARVDATVYRSVRLGGVAGQWETWPWVGVDEHLAHLDSATWLRQQGLEGRVAVRSNSLMNVYSLVCAGVGLGALPCYLGDSDPSLRRMFEPPREWRSELWLLTPPELRKVPRVRSLFDRLYEGTRASVDLLEGRRPQPV
ncbi:LysR family transcriptional regulator [Inhella sp.]|uniref:LysR family transcriptional regulator n=1 Tax=Inhella sp. TaxID=1921806 RepID=UPI0035AED5FA